jgi:hypothetical protein
MFGLCALGTAVGVFATRTTSAQTESIHLDYRADDGCPGAAWFFDQVEERTARARLAAANERGRTFVVTLARGRSGTVGRLAIKEAQRITVAREVTGEQCRDVAAALALATALAIDPLAAIGPAGENSRAAEEAESARNQSTSALTAPADAKAASERPASSGAAAPQDRALPLPAPAGSWAWRAGAGVVLASGLAPGLSAGGAGFVETATERPGAIVSALRVGVFGLRAPEHAVESATSSFRFFFLRPELCSVRLRIAAPFAAVPCIGIDLGVVSASGSNIATPLGDDRFWATGALEVRLRYALSSMWFLQADLGLVFPLTRYRFVFRDPDTLIHAVPALAAMGNAGVGISWP